MLGELKMTKKRTKSASFYNNFFSLHIENKDGILEAGNPDIIKFVRLHYQFALCIHPTTVQMMIKIGLSANRLI